MPRTKKKLPGRGRYIRTMMQLGARHGPAYNLSEDIMAMIKATVAAMLDDLKQTMIDRLDAQDKTIVNLTSSVEGLKQTMIERLDAQDKTIADLTSSVEGLKTSVLDPYNDMVRTQSRFVWAIIGAAVVALFGLVGTFLVNALS